MLEETCWVPWAACWTLREISWVAAPCSTAAAIVDELPTGKPRDAAALGQSLRHEADLEYGLFGLVQQFHLPFRVLLQAARNPADKIGANFGHLGPGRLTTLEFGSLVGSARIATMADPEE